MSNQVINDIIEWNSVRDNMNYDPALEFGMLQEEALEYAHSYIKTVNDWLGFDVHSKEIADEEEAKELNDKVAAYVETDEFHKEWKVNQLDALCDVVFVAVGSIGKLLGSNEKAVQALNAVIEANNQKSTEKNEDGKITKPEGFVPPEGKLKEIIG